jgi:hypothetical protein
MDAHDPAEILAGQDFINRPLIEQTMPEDFSSRIQPPDENADEDLPVSQKLENDGPDPNLGERPGDMHGIIPHPAANDERTKVEPAARGMGIDPRDTPAFIGKTRIGKKQQEASGCKKRQKKVHHFFIKS